MRTNFANHTSIKAHITYHMSHHQAGIFAGGRVQLTIVPYRRDAITVSTTTEQQNACEKALADQFRAPHKHQGAHNLPNKPSTSGNVRGRSRLTRYDCHLSLTGAAPRRFLLQQSNKSRVRKRLKTDFQHQNKQHGAHNSPNEPSRSGNVCRRSRSTHHCH